METTADISKRTLVLTRRLNAPRELVFAAWTDPKHLVRWWGPKDFTLPHCEQDFRVGGA
ncbi:MAG TPA: SRPBCC domain-containing protein, partial [Flavobacteriales bacterium]|nr:SRPBCC domain-containing protein [Flavobacteriales bacterium]